MAVKRYNNVGHATDDIASTTIPPNTQSQPTVQPQESQPLQLPAQPAQQPFAANGLTMTRTPASVINTPNVVNSAAWQAKPVTQSSIRIAQSDIYNAYKNAPNLTPQQRMSGYARAMSKNGYEAGYGDLADLYGGGENEKDREKRLRRERNGRIVAALGDLFGNVINYVHTRNGMPAMKIESRFQPTTERQRVMEQQRQALAQKDFANFYANVSAEKKARNAQKLAAMKQAQDAAIAAQKAAIAAQKAAAADRAAKAKAAQAAQDAADTNAYRQARLELGRQRLSQNTNKGSYGGGRGGNGRINSYPYSYLYRQLITDGYGGRTFNDVLGWYDLMINNKFEYSDANEKVARSFFEKNPMIEKMVKKDIRLNNEMGGNYYPYTDK